MSGRLGSRVSAALLALAFALLAGSAAGEESSFDFLYVEANEGQSSGGHTALRLGEHVYHFENQDGLIVMGRETTREFLYAYALLGNRTIHVSRVALQPADRKRIAASLEQRYLVQDRQLDVQAALDEDRKLLERWLEATHAAPGAGALELEVPALGYFERSDAAESTPGTTHASVRRLRTRIEASGGGSFLRERRAASESALAEALTRDPAGWTLSLPRDPHDRPGFVQPFARRVVDAAAGLAALELLDRGSHLDSEATIVVAGATGLLDRSELDSLARRGRALEQELVRLATSPHADWGRPFLVGLARLLAVEESLRGGRLVLLDVLPPDGPVLPARLLASRSEVLGEMAKAGRGGVEAARLAIVEPVSRGDSSERAWSRLEESVGRLSELERASAEQRDLRLGHRVLLPSRPGVLALQTPALPREHVESALRRVGHRELEHRDALQALYEYQLLSRNCVSELFHALNEAVGGSPEAATAALGGYIDGSHAVAFVPFVAASAVDARYRVVLRRSVPSYRAIALDEMREREAALRVALRESNTLTARSYRRGQHDSFFLFFTDENVALRPLFGVFNLGAALGESLWGLSVLPLDEGETLVSGLEGVITSLPELAFGNIRKGTNDWVAPRPQPLE